MRKLLGILMALLMVAVLFTGCAQPAATPEEAQPAQPTKAPAASTDAPAPAEAARVTIKFAAQADSTPATQAVIDAYNASQDKFTVEWVDMTNDSNAMREQLITTLKAGSAEYDVISMDVVWAGEFAAAGYIEPIDQYMKDAGLKISQFNSGSMASGTYNAKQYVLPFFPDLGLLYFRKDIVSPEDAAKLVSGNYTFDDLLAMANTYKGKGGTQDGYAFQSGLYEGLVCNLAEFTAGWTDVQGGLSAMKAFVDSQAVPADILNYREGETANSFVKGQSVFARNWPYQWGVIKSEGTIQVDQVDIAPLPGGSTVGGWLVGMNKNSAHKDGAWDFMKFLATEQGQKIMSTQGGYLPGFNALLEDADILAGNEMLQMEGFKNALSTTIARPVSAEYAKTSDTIQQNAHKFLSGSQSMEDTVAAINAALGK